MRLRVNEPQFDGREAEYAAEALRSGWVSIRGEFVLRFEKAFAALSGKKFALAVNSGTAALHVGLWALGVRERDRVLIPDFTCPANLTTVLQCGGAPVFADVEEETFGVDAAKLPAIKCKVAELVHVYGFRARDTEKVVGWCRETGAKLLVDASEAHGVDVADADVVVYSCRSEKLVGVGEGGVVCTSDPDLYARMLVFAERGVVSRAVRYWVGEVGCNYLLPNLPAAVGCAQMETLQARTARKRAVGAWYRELLRQERWIGESGVFWMNALVLRETDMDARDLITALASEEIESRPGFYPLHLLPIGDARQACPVTAAAWGRVVCLPSSPHLTQEDVRRVCAAFKRVLYRERA